MTTTPKTDVTLKATADSPSGTPSKARSYTGMTGADLFHQVLKEEGVEVMFGYPGGMVLPIFDSLYESSIKFILTRHEQGAAHMADGYARATGKTGVVLATSGPGATNIVTGLANAYMDSIPMVAFTGQVKSFLIGNDAFQEADITGITRPVTKHNILVKELKDLGRIMHEAFHIASTGRPGPVIVDVPKDVQLREIVPDWDPPMNLPGYRAAASATRQQLEAVLDLVRKAERPIIYASGGR
jgi:acetolactate synthase I/II/III large subunit